MKVYFRESCTPSLNFRLWPVYDSQSKGLKPTQPSQSISSLADVKRRPAVPGQVHTEVGRHLVEP